MEVAETKRVRTVGNTIFRLRLERDQHSAALPHQPFILQFRQIGAEVQMQNEEGEAKSFFVTAIKDGKVTVDGNHPLAGKHLNVHVTILEVRNALPGEERTSGVHAEPMTKH